MTRTFTAHELRDALRLTDDSSTILQYSLLTDPYPLTAGGKATLTLVVSNASRQDVTCTKVAVTIPVGNNAKDLTASSDFGWEHVDGWDIVQTTGTLTCTPKGGTTTFKERGVSFIFTNIVVNDQEGTAPLTIWETAATPNTTPTAKKGTIPMPKFPSTFKLSELTVAPSQVAAGGTTQVMWTGSAAATYVLGYNGGAGYSERSVPNNGPYAATNLTLSPYVHFVLKAKYTPRGETTPVEIQRSAHVDVGAAKPAITSFTGTIVGDRQAKLSWASTNADTARLSGFATPFNATATTDPFDIKHMRYTLVAHNSANNVDSDPASVIVKWDIDMAVQVEPSASAEWRQSRLFITPDGASLIAAADISKSDPQFDGGGDVYRLNASNLSASPIHLDSQHGPIGAPAFSKNGQRLLLGIHDANAKLCLTVRSAPAFSPGPLVDSHEIGGEIPWSAFSPDGSRVYLVSAEHNTLQVRSSSDLSKIAPEEVDIFPCTGPLATSADGTKLFIAGGGKVNVRESATGKVLASIDMPRPSESASSILLDEKGKRLYAVHASWGRIEVFDLESSKHLATVQVGGEPWNPVLSPIGEAIFIPRAASNSLAVIDATALALVAEMPVGEPSIDAVFSPDGTRLNVLTRSGKVLQLKMSAVG